MAMAYRALSRVSVWNKLPSMRLKRLPHRCLKKLRDTFMFMESSYQMNQISYRF